MIISVVELKAMPEFEAMSSVVLQRKIDAVENLIRSYTNNNFQNRMIRFGAPSSNVILGTNPLLNPGDTVEISESVNKGLYTVVEMDYVENTTTLDRSLFSAEYNLITKVEYPASVVEGAINLLLYDVKNRDKVGIQSETLSRHSVTYFNQDAANQVIGYPASLTGFLRPFIKARF